VPRVGEQISRVDLASAAEQLRTVLAAVPTDPDHSAYLRGATDTLAMLAAFADDSRKCPETKVDGVVAGIEESAFELHPEARCVVLPAGRGLLVDPNLLVGDVAVVRVAPRRVSFSGAHFAAARIA
jgi:hypothetical protein